MGQEIQSSIQKRNKKLLQLLKNEEFYAKIRKGWKLGGLTTKRNNTGIHAASGEERRRWSIYALKKISKTSIGPSGEKMYNWLEVYTANIFKELNIDYVYEKIFHVKNTNGFVSVDFTTKHLPNLLVEVTYWNKSKQKSEELIRKFILLKESIPEAELIVVVPRNHYENYCRYLQKTIKVLTPIQFKRYLSSRLAG